MVIGAHNYRNHFGRLGSLKFGDVVIIVDSRGDEHRYVVESVTTLNETEVTAMINSPFDLTLFTCTPDRKDRVTVRLIKV
jgi:sortase A